MTRSGRQRFLVVKLADLGDTLTATPALRALRQSIPDAMIDALVTSVGASALDGLDSVDHVHTFEKALFDRGLPSPSAVTQAIRLGLALRLRRYDRVFLLHHLFTGGGRLKYHGLLAAIGAPWSGGLAERCPAFLNEAALDRGYGVRHEVDYWLDVVGLAGARAPSPRLEIFVGPTDRQAAGALLPDAVAMPTWRVALYPGTGTYSLARRWPEERFVEVGRRLEAIAVGRGGSCEIVVLGGPSEQLLAARVATGIGTNARSLAGQTSLKTLAAVLERCDLLVGNDGGVTHVAAAVGAPIVAIFGPSNAGSWGPYGAVEWCGPETPLGRSVVVRQDLPCSPCLYRGFLPGTSRGCRTKDCLTLSTSNRVVAAAQHVLNGRQR
jgi:heptosyltransferase-2